jgi:hypothetical protein
VIELLRERGRIGDQHDAFCISRTNQQGTLADFADPDLTPAERAPAESRGVDFGLPASGRCSGAGRVSSVRLMSDHLEGGCGQKYLWLF